MSEAWVCAERKANHGANDPPECNWPYCGCDPEAESPIETNGIADKAYAHSTVSTKRSSF